MGYRFVAFTFVHSGTNAHLLGGIFGHIQQVKQLLIVQLQTHSIDSLLTIANVKKVTPVNLSDAKCNH